MASDHAAKVGSQQLLASLDGLEASRQASVDVGAGQSMHLTLVGHSYGSLTSGLAVREQSSVDDVVFIGSPGVGANSASDIQGVPVGHVYDGLAQGDPIVDWFGVSPETSRFGARLFQTDGGPNPLTGQQLKASHGHSQYFDLGTESVNNMALIAIGRPDLVTFDPRVVDPHSGWGSHPDP